MKRILSFLLSLSMVISMLPVSVFGSEIPVPEETLPPETTEAAQTEVPTEPSVPETTVETEPSAEETTIPHETQALTGDIPATEEAEEVYTLSEPIFASDPEGPSNEELFAGYVEQQFYGSSFSPFGISAGKLLTGDTKMVYDAAVPQIRKMAAGELDRSVIAIGKSFSNFPADVVLTEPFSSNDFTDEQVYDLLWALLADLPYDLYWMDKTIGISVGVIRPGGKLSQVIVSLTVAGAYRNTAAGMDQYDLDTTKTRAATTAAANARAIAAEYAGASDYEKLLGFKNEICSLVSYNRSAASNSSTPYGDPWQMIYVFDNDPKTNVVCEGYTKAFQYLCEMSTFEVDVLCNNVTGTIPSGGHMWNIVSVEGKNYLADITNSDAGTAGASGSLFLVGGSGSITSGYVFAGTQFKYNTTAYETWGTGPDSILHLDTKKLTAANFPTSSMVNFKNMLAGTDPAVLSTPLTLTENITLPRDLTIAEGGSLIVPKGITLTVPAGFTLTNQGNLQVQSGGTMALSGTISGSMPKLDSGSTVTGTGTYLSGSVRSADELTSLLCASLPYGAVQIPIRAAMTLTDSAAIPANVTLEISGAEITVASPAVLANQGTICLGSGTILLLQKGAKLTGNSPVFAADDAFFVDLNILTQAQLTAMLETQEEVVMDQTLILTDDLTIPAGKTLTITGEEAFLVIPAGKHLTNQGQIYCQGQGGILADGGTLTNHSQIHTQQWGILDMTGGTYEAPDGAMVYNHHTAAKDGALTSSTVEGISYGYVTVTADGFSQAQIRDMLNQMDSSATPPAALNFLVSRNLTLSGEFIWPSYGTMTIPEGVTLTVARGAEVISEGQIFLSGQLICNGAMDTSLNPIQVLRTLPSGLSDQRLEAYIRENILRASGELPAFLFPGMAPSQLNCLLPSGDGTADNPVAAGIGTAVPIQMLPASPLGADVLSYYYMFQIVDGDGQLLVDLFGDGFMPYEGEVYYGSQVLVRSDTAGTVTLRITPRNRNFESYGPEYARDVVISFLKKHLEVTAGGAHFPHGGTEYNLWAGSSMTLMPTLVSENGTPAEGRIQYSIDGGEAREYTGQLTITAPQDLTNRQNTTVVFTAEGVDPVQLSVCMHPAASAVDVVQEGSTLTGQTIPVDLSQGISSFPLSALVRPAEAFLADAGSIHWTTSDDRIAAVDNSGTVTFTGQQTGRVTITVTADFGAAKNAHVVFDVVDRSRTLSSHQDNPTALIGGSGDSFLAVDTATGESLDSKEVRWFLSDDQGQPLGSHPYAAITETGKLTTKSVADPDVVYLMAQAAEGNPAQMLEPIAVTLYPAVSQASILHVPGELCSGTWLYDPSVSGHSFSLGWAASPCGESAASAAWKSSNKKIADIDNSGKVTVLGTGTVTFTLTVTALNGKKTTATVKIKFATFTQTLTITPSEAVTLASGEDYTFSAISAPDSVTTPGYTWQLSHKNAGSISSKGVFKAKTVVNPTTVELTAVSKDGSCVSDPVAITVMPKEGALVLCQVDEEGNALQGLTKTTQTLTMGDTLNLAANSDVEWTSSKPSVATVDPEGRLTATGNGTATITAKAADNRKAAFTLKVTKQSRSVTVSVKNNAEAQVASGKSLNLVGTVTYNDGSSDAKVTWTMEDSSLATLSSSGKLAAAKNLLSGGTVYVRAAAKDGTAVSDPFPVQIQPLVTALEIHGPFTSGGASTDVTNTTQKLDMNTRTSFALSVQMFPAGSRQDVSWKSSSEKIATIDPDGMVRCLNPGTVTFTATANDGSGKKASFKLTVLRAARYVRLPEAAFVGGGKKLTITKLEGFQTDPDATSKTLDWSMTMISSNAEKAVPQTIATLSSTGMLKTKAVDAPVTLRIRASSTDGSNKTALCTVTVYPVVKGVSIYGADGVDLSRKVVSLSAGSAFTIFPDTTNDPGYGLQDDGTADEYTRAGAAWTITASHAALTWDAGTTGRITVTAPDSLAGKTVKLTLKANDGSGKSAYVSFKITRS